MSVFPQNSPVTPESAALLAQIENHCTVECCNHSFRSPWTYSPWNRAAVEAAADLWALRHGWPPELVRATYKSSAFTPAETCLVAWNATTGVLKQGLYEEA